MATILSSCNCLVKRLKYFGPLKTRNTSSDVEKTTLDVLNQSLTDILLIDAFSQNGFRLNIGFNIIGSIAIFPQTVLSWMVTNEREITEDSMTLFHLLEPRLDILVIGYGDQGNKVQPSIIQSLTRKHICVEVLPTEHACSTYNFLVAEGRQVAGALIPPSLYRKTDSDIIHTKIQNRRLFELDS